MVAARPIMPPNKPSTMPPRRAVTARHSWRESTRDESELQGADREFPTARDTLADLEASEDKVSGYLARQARDLPQVADVAADWLYLSNCSRRRAVTA
jgi:hypothetical protein